MSDALLDLVLAGGTRTVVVVGTAKNVGKTVTFNALRAAAARRGLGGAATSIGRDGEPADALDGSPKPRVRLEAGTLVAIPRDLLSGSPALEILELGERSALGPVVFARVRVPTYSEIGGPPTARAMRATIDRLCALCAGPVFVDGAIDRIAALAGGGDAVVVATGPASGADAGAVAEAARITVRRLQLPGRDPAHEHPTVVCFPAALDARDAYALMDAAQPVTAIVSDPTRVAVGGALLGEFLRRCDVRCERPLRLVACTTSSTGGGRTLDPRALVEAVAAATGLPVFDVVAGCAA